jgi:hypothetical protein
MTEQEDEKKLGKESQLLFSFVCKIIVDHIVWHNPHRSVDYTCYNQTGGLDNSSTCTDGHTSAETALYQF